MKTLLKNGKVINVFTGEITDDNVLIDGSVIAGVGAYDDADADVVEDVQGKYVCPSFIDGHIHIESTMLLPATLAAELCLHGTGSIVADPHEIANVMGKSGLDFMIKSAQNPYCSVYYTLPSCVPATGFDQAGATLSAKDLKKYYSLDCVLGLGEMMNFPAVINGDKAVHAKITDAKQFGKTVNGHAPLLSGKNLDKYISAGIYDDHECTSEAEGLERLRKGQWLMIRQGTAARNLADLLAFFDEPYFHRCLLVTDDKHPADIIANGHIDGIIRLAVQKGKSAVNAIRMATINAAQCFNLKQVGTIAAGYAADITVLDNLTDITVNAVYKNGVRVVKDGKRLELASCCPSSTDKLLAAAKRTFRLKELCESDFAVKQSGSKCRVIGTVNGQLLTNEVILSEKELKKHLKDGTVNKIAVIERHHGTGNIGLGYVTGLGVKCGALASSVSHDSHNLTVIGASDSDMAVAANYIKTVGGGYAIVKDGKVIAAMPLPVAGLMTEVGAAEAAAQNSLLREKIAELGVPQNVEPFMTTAFIALTVIPSLKLTTLGLVDVNKQQLVPLMFD